jgi:phosphoribosylaminoimidazolecarboxamide formyltransferase/IMP cyclohydrolase
MGGGNILTAIGGEEQPIEVKTALVSVYYKDGLEELAALFKEKGVHVLSTGGTAKKMRELGCTVQDVADYTGSPEILDGRVKTLHPKIHGGILNVRGHKAHEEECAQHGIKIIDVVVANLYPFELALQQNLGHASAIENIDIGGPCMVRASAKSHQGCAILSDPSQYAAFIQEVRNNGCTSPLLRRKLAAEAFAKTADYDAKIARYWSSTFIWPATEGATPVPAATAYPPAQPQQAATGIQPMTVSLKPERPLKYGCNPHQLPASICSVDGMKMPIEVLNGTPGYINWLDAINAWGLVKELKAGTGLPAAASFKHVSPAGAAVAVPLTELEKKAFEVTGDFSGVSLAYVRARNADPLCSFGDYVAVSDPVDDALAEVLRTAVSDGIVAPDFTPTALEVLKKKKSGGFVVIKADPNAPLPELEVRTLGGVGLVQKRNDAMFTKEHCADVVTKTALSPEAIRDCIVASIAIKYTQSNSVGYAKNGMMLGVGAGQQSRVDCVKLAGKKTAKCHLMQHPKVLGLPFKEGTKKQTRINARVAYIEGDMTPIEKQAWLENFDSEPAALSEAEKAEFVKTLSGVTISSDAFFPFRDSIDHAARYGVSNVVQPGGSVQDKEVTEACDQYGMAMCFTKLRLFHH